METPSPSSSSPAVAAPAYFYEAAGTQIGPVGVEEIRALVRDGQLAADAFLLREGQTEWKKAKALLPALFPAEIAKEKAANAPVAPSSMKVAGFWPKAGAYLVDVTILGVIAGIGYGMSGTIEAFSIGLLTPIAGLIFIATLAVTTIYFPYFWAVRMRTPGMQLFGLRVRTLGGAKVPIPTAIGRLLATILSALPLYLGYFWCLWNEKHQTWHDILAGTVVVEEA